MGGPVRHLGYQHLLGGVVLLYLLIIVVPIQQVGGPLRVAVLGALLLAAVRTRRRAGIWATPALLLALGAVLATLIALIVGSETVLICVSQASTVVLVVVTIVVLAQTLLAAGVIDGPAVRGVLCIYLLLGLLFSAMHGFFAPLISDYLKGVDGQPTQSDTLYFSLITLTTVGYGDITPVADVARAIAAAEALTGQLYLVSIVAAVVSRYKPSSRLRTAATDASESDAATSDDSESTAGANGDGDGDR
jgi:Ion channel